MVAILVALLFAAASVAGIWLVLQARKPRPVALDGPSGQWTPEPPQIPDIPHVMPPDPPRATAAPSPPPVASGVPQTTQVKKRGAITIVDLGVDSQRSLSDELALQRTAAQAEGQTLVLMMTRYGNKLLDDFDAAVPDPLMQSALTNVRLVRVDGRYFLVELTELGIPTDSFPWFFLLGTDLSPKDGINGGEWDDDVARNIAPVLGAFVKGTYKKRREIWKPKRRQGVEL